MKKTITLLLLICLVSGLADYAFAAQKIMTVYQRAAGDEAIPHSIPGFNDFATPVGTGVTVDKPNATIRLGGGVANTDGAVWYGGDSAAAFCVNGKCNFGIGIRAYFEFKFLTTDISADSTTYGNGFTFAIINGSNNDKTKRGGSPGTPPAGGLEALMGYAGPGNTTDQLGLEPPKMAIEFDTYPNRGLYTATECTNNNRYDANNLNNFNHLALMLWGANTAGTCPSGYTRISYDDNVHRAGTAASNTVPQNSYRGDGTGGYYEGPTVTWLEDGNTHLFRIEIIRESISTDTTGNYIVKAWVDCAGCTAAQLAAFKDTSLPFPPTPTLPQPFPQINRTPVVLSTALHTAFNTMLFGFTQATGAGAQNIEIKNFNIYFPPCASDAPPGTGWTYCADEGGTCTFTGTKLVAYGRDCFYNYLTATGSKSCSNTTADPVAFGDPVVGVVKKCYYK
jgi:hypothetical protein